MPDSIELFRQIAEHTRPRCGVKCNQGNPDRCCSPLYCEAAEKEAASRGIILPRQPHPRLPFMGQTGCVVPAHLRPACALHDCTIGNLGFDPDDPEWTDKYFELRDAIGEAMYAEMKDA